MAYTRNTDHRNTDHRLLSIYLNDHFAGAVAGSALADRVAGANRENERYQPALNQLAAEIKEDRDELRSLMRRLDVSVDCVKPLGGLMAEKLGRLKLNGQLRGYSPLSRVEELEAMRIAVTGKQMLWIALETLASTESRLEMAELERLAARALRQSQIVETLHKEALREVLE